MPVIPLTLVIACPKLPGVTATVQKDCHLCEKLGGVSIHGEYGIDITCDENKRAVVGSVKCCKTHESVDLRQKCYLCNDFYGLTFQGQELRLLCKLGELPPKDYVCNICKQIVDDPEQEMWAEDERNHPNHKGFVCALCATGKREPLIWFEDPEDNNLLEMEGIDQ